MLFLTTRRYLVALFILIVLLVLGIGFHTYVMKFVIEPFVMVLWAIFRVFLSIPQEVYWTGLIILACVVAIILLPTRSEENQQSGYHDPKQQFNRLEYWQSMLKSAPIKPTEDQALKENLQRLIKSLKQLEGGRGEADSQDTVIQQGTLPVRASTFLNLVSISPENPIKSHYKWLPAALQNLKKKTSLGYQNIEEYYDSVEEVLHSIETDLGIEHD